jgi:hypothetical protein
MIAPHLTGGMIAAAGAGFCLTYAMYGLAAFVGSFLSHFHEVNR